MIKGLYTAASGMMVQMTRQDVIANNIANASTSGYKKQVAVSKAFPDMLMSRFEQKEGQKITGNNNRIGGLGTGVCLDQVVTDLSIGNENKTDISTDLSIVNGYFVIETQEGERYTRNGAFKVNSEGVLTDSQGNPVLDKNDQHINISSEFTVDRQGSITFSDGEESVTLKVVEFTNPQYLQRVGDSLYSDETGAASSNISSNPGILQGYLEQSNVNAVKEMIDLITVVRSYESLQKVVQAEDETVGVAIEKVGSTS